MTARAAHDAITLEPWGADDLPLLEQLMGDPRMMRHLGPPEDAEQIANRHAFYLRLAEQGIGRVFKVIDDTGRPLGAVAYWSRQWQGQDVYEIAAGILPEHQRRGIASAAVALLIAAAQAEGKHRYVHAFPSVANAPANAALRKLGFTLTGTCPFEYGAPGRYMQSHDWRFDLADTTAHRLSARG